MHYLQNTWFVHNWMWVITALVLVVVFIAYVNNRKVLLRRTLAALSLSFVISISTSTFYFKQGNTVLKPSITLEQVEQENADVENTSVLTTISNAVITILSNKVSK